jgi:hypothetical protein
MAFMILEPDAEDTCGICELRLYERWTSLGVPFPPSRVRLARRAGLRW